MGIIMSHSHVKGFLCRKHIVIWPWLLETTSMTWLATFWYRTMAWRYRSILSILNLKMTTISNSQGNDSLWRVYMVVKGLIHGNELYKKIFWSNTSVSIPNMPWHGPKESSMVCQSFKRWPYPTHKIKVLYVGFAWCSKESCM